MLKWKKDAYHDYLLCQLLPQFRCVGGVYLSSSMSYIKTTWAARPFGWVFTLSITAHDYSCRAPKLFAKSAQVHVRHAETECRRHNEFIKNFKAEDLEYNKD